MCDCGERPDMPSSGCAVSSARREQRSCTVPVWQSVSLCSASPYQATRNVGMPISSRRQRRLPPIVAPRSRAPRSHTGGARPGSACLPLTAETQSERLEVLRAGPAERDRRLLKGPSGHAKATSGPRSTHHKRVVQRAQLRQAASVAEAACRAGHAKSTERAALAALGTACERAR
jgi:hypothetical protein